MFLKIFLRCLLLWCELTLSDATNQKGAISGHTTGGIDATKFEVPYIVAILKDAGRVGTPVHCGGSIISRKFIISAAHCFIGMNVRSMRILAGERNLNRRGAGAQLVPVKKVIVHEMYNPVTLANDIAIVELGRKLTFTNVVQPISIPLNGTRASGVAKLSGWGETEPKLQWGPVGPSPAALQTVNLTIISRPECDRLHQQIQQRDIFVDATQSSAIGVDPPTSTHICAGAVPVGGKDACNGDSGGPLECWRKVGNGRQEGYLCGVVSGGYGCGLGLPSWYTEVAQFYSWILKHTNGTPW